MLLKAKNPRTIFRVAFACLALSGVLGIPSVSASLGVDLVDALRGALLGATVALLYFAFRLQRRSA